MARKLRLFFPGAIYHVMFRGNGRQSIFKGDRDRQHMLERLEASAETFRVDIYLYCLMPNHVHLLVCTPLANLDRFMRSLLTGYTVYFNRRHETVGHVLQGRYKAQVVAGDEYLLKLSRYIHLNPAFSDAWKEKPLPQRVAHLREYPWSSYRAYAGLSKPAVGLKTGPLRALVRRFAGGTPQGYAKYVELGLVTDDAEKELWSSDALALGDVDFVETMRDLYQQSCARYQREDTDLRPVRCYQSPESVWKTVLAVCDVDEKLLRARKEGAVRGMMAWALQRHAGLTQRQIAEWLGLTTGAAVSLLLGRLQRFSSSGASKIQQWQRQVNLTFKD